MKKIISVLMAFLALANGAVRIDSSGESVQYPIQSVDWDDGGVTIMAWGYIVNDRSSDSAFVSARGAGILNVNATRNLCIYTGSSEITTGATVVAVGVWHHYAFTRSNQTWRAYIDGVLAVYHDQLVEPTGDPQPRFGNDNYDSWLDGRVAAGKVWLAPLSTSEIQAEMNSYSAVRTANIWSVVPMRVHTDLADQSGQGNSPSAVGTLSTESGPPALDAVAIGRISKIHGLNLKAR